MTPTMLVELDKALLNVYVCMQWFLDKCRFVAGGEVYVAIAERA